MYTRMLLVLGIVFQMPTLVFFLAKMGLVTARFLASQFKYAILVIFIVAAVVTPSGDPYNQTILALPMIGLYLLSIVIAWIFAPVAKKSTAEPTMIGYGLHSPAPQADAGDTKGRQLDAARSGRACAKRDDRGLAGIHVAGLSGDVRGRPETADDLHVRSGGRGRRPGPTCRSISPRSCRPAGTCVPFESVNVYELPLDTSRTHAAIQRDRVVRVRLLLGAGAEAATVRSRRATTIGMMLML